MKWTLILLLLAGCGSTATHMMDVRSYSDPQKVHELVALRTFSVLPVDTYDPLQEKEILYLLRLSLFSRGYVLVKRNPDFIVSIAFSIDPVQRTGTKLVPIYTKSTTPSHSGGSGSAGGAFLQGLVQGFADGTPSSYVPVPYSEIGYHRSITVYINSPGGVPLWQGEVESTGSTSDLLVVAPYLLDELLDEFPQKTGKETRRIIRVNN